MNVSEINVLELEEDELVTKKRKEKKGQKSFSFAKDSLLAML